MNKVVKVVRVVVVVCAITAAIGGALVNVIDPPIGKPVNVASIDPPIG